MASCDDDFSYLADDHFTNHHHHPPQHQDHRYLHPKLSPSPAENDAVKGSAQGSSENGAVLEAINPYGSGEFDSNPDPKISRVSESSEKREREKEQEREREDDVSDGSFKKARHAISGGGGGGEYRKDREEWSDAAIECLLDAYTEKFTQLNRGNLRGRDWEEVAVIVSDKSENQSKSVEQCKNKVDNLKKRYKLEKHRMTSAGVDITHWPWFKKMDFIVVNSLSAKAVSDEDKVGGGASSCGSAGRQSNKRYTVGTPGTLGQVNNSKSALKLKWKRVVFKISGAALAGSGPHNVDPKVILLIASEVATAYRIGVQVAIVIGGRNFFCGDTWIAATGVDRSTTYQIGMMATVMNSLLLQSALEKMGVQTRVQTAFALPEVGEPYNRHKAIKHLEKGRVVIFGGAGGGSGNPLFSTDTAAALRAIELNAQALLKGINVDAIYDCNIRNNGNTFEHFSFKEASSRGPTSMDVMALTFCEENTIPVVLFNLLEPGNISKALRGDQIGTLIDQKGSVS